MIKKHLGYYTCNGKEFQSKVNALIYSKVTNQPVKWVFHDQVYDSYNWAREPAESIDALYDRRAKELREKYDYLVLSYSGGSDTHNILESFIRQGLHIDEIVTNHMTEATKSVTILDHSATQSSNFAAEHQLQAVPRLQYIYDHLPKTKITTLDVSDVVLNEMSKFDDAEWVVNRNDHLSIGQLFRYNYFHFGNLKKQFDKNLSIGIIVGLDKPKTYIDDNNNFWLYFIDNVANITTVNDFNSDYTNTTTELFYWSNESADMVCKQAHVIKRWLDMNPDKQEYWRNVDYTKMRLYHEKILRDLIYTTWNNDWFQTDKSVNWWHTEFDTWFRTNPEFSKQYSQWESGINYLADKLGDKFILSNGSKPDSFIKFKKSYCIGKMAPTKFDTKL
jgi:hypothetical protein